MVDLEYVPKCSKLFGMLEKHQNLRFRGTLKPLKIDYRLRGASILTVPTGPGKGIKKTSQILPFGYQKCMWSSCCHFCAPQTPLLGPV